MGQDVISPAAHTAFTDVSSMLDFIERLADATGLPVGIKSAVGEIRASGTSWRGRCDTTGRAPDFITIDGGEGGTGAAPLVFSDHVALPFKLGFAAVYGHFAEERRARERGLHRLGQARLPRTRRCSRWPGLRHGQRRPRGHAVHRLHPGPACHTGHCPTGVATQNAWLVAASTPRSRPRASPTTSSPCAKICSASPTPAARSTPAWSASTASTSSTASSAAPPARSSAIAPGWGLPGPDLRSTTETLLASSLAARIAATGEAPSH
jgi:hypothetical protein